MTIDWRPPPLHTPRLLLRGIGTDDRDDIFAYASNPNVTRFTIFETHRSLDDTQAFLDGFVAAHYAEQEPSPYGICWKEWPARILGTIGCHWASREHRKMELGYAIGEEFWGRGIVVEAARALLDHVFANYDVIRVQAHCVPENAASERVMQKLGMIFEGRLRSAIIRRGVPTDVLLYSVLKNEWGATRIS